MTTNNPLVSVIIPCYNHEKYIAQCVQSVVNQTYANMEIFVLDDGSTDGSLAIIKALADKHGFFAESHYNMGISATLNKGIKQYAKGKYICIVASDDYWEETKVEKQVAFYEQHPEMGFIFGRTWLVDDDNRFLGYDANLPIANYQVFREQLSNQYAPICNFETLVYGNFIPALTVMIKKALLEEVGYFDEQSAIEDWDMWVRLANKYSFAFQNEFLGFYRVHDSNISNDHPKMKTARNYLIKKWREDIPQSNRFLDNILLWEIADNCITNKKRAAQLIFPNMHLFFKYKSFRKSFRRLFLKFRNRK